MNRFAARLRGRHGFPQPARQRRRPRRQGREDRHRPPAPLPRRRAHPLPRRGGGEDHRGRHLGPCPRRSAPCARPWTRSKRCSRTSLPTKPSSTRASARGRRRSSPGSVPSLLHAAHARGHEESARQHAHPFQRDQVSSMDPDSQGRVAHLYKEKASFYERSARYKETMPWSLASMGGQTRHRRRAGQHRSLAQALREYRQLITDFRTRSSAARTPTTPRPRRSTAKNSPSPCPSASSS